MDLLSESIALQPKKIESDDKTRHSSFYSNSKVETITNASGIDYVFESINTIIYNIQIFLGHDLGWIIDLVIGYKINMSKYNPLAGSNYINLPKELDHRRKGLIEKLRFHINECFKINGKQRIKMPKKLNTLGSKIMKEK